ncbi:hypothetical protein DY468_00465 [Rhodopseudomonas sp. BR0M22]|nr:hypothetical protein [Rhodopseudomonas sp. BR0M22]
MRDQRFQEIQLMPFVRIEVDPARLEITVVNNGTGIGDIYEFFMILGERHHVVKNGETNLKDIRERGSDFLRWAVSVPKTSFQGKFENSRFELSIPRGALMPGQRHTILRFFPQGVEESSLSDAFLSLTDSMLFGVCFTNVHGNLNGRYAWGDISNSHNCDPKPTNPLGLDWGKGAN